MLKFCCWLRWPHLLLRMFAKYKGRDAALAQFFGEPAAHGTDDFDAVPALNQPFAQGEDVFFRSRRSRARHNLEHIEVLFVDHGWTQNEVEQ